MIRTDKDKLIASMNERFNETPHAVLAAYSGLTANSVNELRRKVDSIGGKYTVIKVISTTIVKDTRPVELEDEL